MSKKFDQIEKAQKEFNRRYGVDFDIEELDASLSGLSEFGVGVGVDNMYRMKFTSLYEKAYVNFIDRKLGDRFDFADMLNEFDKNIMEPYRALCAEEKSTPPKTYGGWRMSEYLASANRFLARVPENKLTYAKERYHGGKLSLSDMRKHVNDLKKKGNAVTKEELSAVDCYLRMLTEDQKGRTFAENFRHPVRYFMEWFSMSRLTKFLEEKTGGALTVENGQNPTYEEISKLTEDGTIAQTKEALTAGLKLATEREGSDVQNTNNKETVDLSGTDLFRENSNVSKQVKSTAPTVNNELNLF